MTKYSHGCGVDMAYVAAPAGSRDGGVAAAHRAANAGADELEWMEICARTNADAVVPTDVLGAGTSEGLEALPGLLVPMGLVPNCHQAMFTWQDSMLIPCVRPSLWLCRVQPRAAAGILQ